MSITVTMIIAQVSLTFGYLEADNMILLLGIHDSKWICDSTSKIVSKTALDTSTTASERCKCFRRTLTNTLPFLMVEF